MVYTIVTERQYIPSTKNGKCNFLVLESTDELNENKYIYIIIDHICSIELNTCNNTPEIQLYVDGKSNVIILREDQREILFNIINNYMDSDIEDSNKSESEEEEEEEDDDDDDDDDDEKNIKHTKKK